MFRRLVPTPTVSMTARHNLWLIKRALLLLLCFPLTAIAQPGVYTSPPEPPVVVEEVVVPKPIPDSVLCNCWSYVKREFPALPSTREILNSLTSSGTVAVFYYAESRLYHYAVVRGETDTHYLIEETNFRRCQHGVREVPRGDKSLLGFFHI